MTNLSLTLLGIMSKQFHHNFDPQPIPTTSEQEMWLALQGYELSEFGDCWVIPLPEGLVVRQHKKIAA
jgi:hypothetical protein